ncbi:MAG: hypothetical protein ABI843_15115 [Dokdonella sp.]
MTLELVVGAFFAAFTVLLFADAKFCWYGGKGCGMWEPVFAIYMLPIAISLLLAGLLHRYRKNVAAAIAFIPAALVVLILVGQAQLWW